LRAAHLSLLASSPTNEWKRWAAFDSTLTAVATIYSAVGSVSENDLLDGSFADHRACNRCLERQALVLTADVAAASSGVESRAKIDDSRIANGLLVDGFTTNSISDDNHHFGFKAFGRYEINRYFALESGYFDLGKFGFMADTLPAGSLRGDINIKGVNFDAVGSVPIGDKFSLFARVGVNYADSKDSFSGTGAVAVIDPSALRKQSIIFLFNDCIALATSHF
jgi:OmpA family protein